jgi:23S rRNA (uridine2552-2'-O)-methyltransferase
MKKNKTSRAWVHRHINDHYVQESRRLGYRSRAAFKLTELDDKHRFLKPGIRIVELGAAPGSWSQVVLERTHRRGTYVLVDLLPMDPIPGAIILQGDFTDDDILRQVLESTENKPLDLVLSDMSPNLSGIRLVDQPRIMYLGELVLEFAIAHLVPETGACVIKTFQGEGFEAFLKAFRAAFKQVAIRKPDASRDCSNELYIVGQSLKPTIKKSSQGV